MAAKEILGRLEDILECPVCLERFKQPRSLPCQHSFCTECLQGLLGTGRKIRCPCCNKYTDIRNGVEELPVDFRSNTLLETIHQTVEAAEGVLGAEGGAEAALVESCEKSQDARPCPICEEIPTETKYLSCGHHLCGDCMQFLLPVGGKTLHCPTCSNEAQILPSSVVGQPGAKSAGVDLSQLLPMLESLTRAVAAQVPSQQPGGHPQQPSQSQEPALPCKPGQHSPKKTENAPAESRLTFHSVCGENAVIHTDGRTAHRKNPYSTESDALVLTSRHLKPNELFEVRLDKTVEEWTSSLQIGVTAVSPKEFDLPESMYDLGSRTWFMRYSKVHHKVSKKWKGIRQDQRNWQDLGKLKVGDHVAVQRRADSSLHFYINGVDVDVGLSDIPAEVYGVISLYGKAAQVTIVDTSAQGMDRTPIFQVGQKVQVKPRVVEPEYGWGLVTRHSVGTVIAIDIKNQKVTVNFPESRLWTALMSEMEPVPTNNPNTRDPASEVKPAESVGAVPYKTRTDFGSNADYETYIWDNIQVGMRVHCCRTYQDVNKGDIGQVIKLDPGPLKRPNIEVYWHKGGDTHRVSYIHVELLGFPSPDIGADGRRGRYKHNFYNHSSSSDDDSGESCSSSSHYKYTPRGKGRDRSRGRRRGRVNQTEYADRMGLSALDLRGPIPDRYCADSDTPRGGGRGRGRGRQKGRGSRKPRPH